MSITIQILDGPLPPASCRAPGEGRDERLVAGALLAFEGIVRPIENDRPISALIYQAYEPMASAEMRRLAEDIHARHGLLAIVVEHSRGRVPAGRCAFLLRVTSLHRKAALAAMEEFIDRMKQDVPIWKSPEFAENRGVTVSDRGLKESGQ